VKNHGGDGESKDMEEKQNSFIFNGAVAALLIISISVVTYIFLKSRPRTADGTPAACTLEAKICPDGTSVGRVGPTCDFEACPEDTGVKEATCMHPNIKIIEPQPLDKISFPYTVKGVVGGHRDRPNCNWVLFEGQAGSMELQDMDGTVLGQGPLKATDDWMSPDEIHFEGELQLIKQPKSHTGTLFIKEEDASGGGKPQQLAVPVNY